MAAYIIEHGTENNRWLSGIRHDGKGVYHQQTNSYKPQIEEALVFEKRAEAVAFAQKWRGRVWMIRGGVPVKQVYPQANA